MFSEAQKSAYRTVRAPDALRERVLDMADEKPRQKKRPMRRWMTTAAAACLMLVLLATALLPKGSTGILTGGAVIGSEPVPLGENAGVAMARAAEMLSVPLTVKPRGTVTLSPEDGMLRSGDALIAARCVIDAPTDLIWEIESPDTAKTYVLRVESGDESSALMLAFDADENCWTVFAAQE